MAHQGAAIPATSSASRFLRRERGQAVGFDLKLGDALFGIGVNRLAMLSGEQLAALSVGVVIGGISQRSGDADRGGHAHLPWPADGTGDDRNDDLADIGKAKGDAGGKARLKAVRDIEREAEPRQR